MTYTDTHTLIYIEGASEFETWKDINHRKTDDKQKKEVSVLKNKISKTKLLKNYIGKGK